MGKIQWISSQANTFAKEYGQTLSTQNTLRHAYWQTRLTVDIDENLAKSLGDAHEQGGIFEAGSGEQSSNKGSQMDREVDLFNNKVARRIGKQLGSNATPAQIERAVIIAYERGEFREIRPTVELENRYLRERRAQLNGRTLTPKQLEKEYKDMVDRLYFGIGQGTKRSDYKLVPSGRSAPPEISRYFLREGLGVRVSK